MLKQEIICTIPKGTKLGYPGNLAVAMLETDIEFSAFGLSLLVGRNGEGKTTFMRYLCGCQSDQPPSEYRRAYLPEELGFPGEMSSNAVARACLKNTARAWFHEMAGRTSLPSDKQIGHLSKGNKQKVRNLIALALSRQNDAELLCLDEPMSGLDFCVRRVFWKIIEEEALLRHVLLSMHPSEILASPLQVIAIRKRVVSVMPDPNGGWQHIENWLEVKS